MLPMQISCESACSMLSGSGQSLFSVGLNFFTPGVVQAVGQFCP